MIDAIREFLDRTVFLDAPKVPTVGVGPLVWGIKPQDGRYWYVICSSGDKAGEFHVDYLSVDRDDQELGTRVRLLLLAELVQRPPIVIHEFTDQLEHAAFCCAIWPGEKTRKIYEGMKAELGHRP